MISYETTLYVFKDKKQSIILLRIFYCHAAKLVIELDGSQHYEEQHKRYDDFRTEILEGYDLTVIRFTNTQVKKNFEGVCQYIDQVVRKATEIQI